MMRVGLFGLLYFVIVFAAGFLLGSIRVLLIAPAIGPFAAVLVELPVMLTISWLAAGFLLRQMPLGDSSAAAAGILAFALLMIAEAALAVSLGGRSLGEFLDHQLTADGLIGLAGQVLFATFPYLGSRRRDVRMRL